MIRPLHSGCCFHAVTIGFVLVVLSRPTNVFGQDQDSTKTQQETNVEKSASASPFRLETQELFELMMVPGVDELDIVANGRNPDYSLVRRNTGKRALQRPKQPTKFIDK